MTIEEALAELEDSIKGAGYQCHIETYEMAIAALRAQQEAERNKALTLEELREMTEDVAHGCSHTMIDVKTGQRLPNMKNTRADGLPTATSRRRIKMGRAFDVCQFCCFYPASSLDGKPCCMCTASGREVKTNADRIRAMSDEKLSEYLAEIGSGANNGAIYSDRPEEWLEWLQQPAKEGNNG